MTKCIPIHVFSKKESSSRPKNRRGLLQTSDKEHLWNFQLTRVETERLNAFMLRSGKWPVTYQITTHTHKYLKWILNLNLKAKTTNFPEENIEQNLCKLYVGKYFFNRTQYENNLIRLKILNCSSKDNSKRIRRHSIGWLEYLS